MTVNQQQQNFEGGASSTNFCFESSFSFLFSSPFFLACTSGLLISCLDGFRIILSVVFSAPPPVS